MRKYFDKFLADYADVDKNIRLIIADVGDFPEFKKRHLDKYINVGVSETNAIGVASALADEGFNVFVYGISAFFLYRCHELLRHNCLFNIMPIKFVGVGFGWKYFGIGSGHFCPDDIGLCLSLGMNIYVPSKISELIKAIHSNKKEPIYIRLTADIRDEYKNSDNLIYSPNILVSYGEMANLTTKIYKNLRDKDKDLGYMIINNINQEMQENLSQKLKGKRILVIEDQISMYGLTTIIKNNNLELIYSKTLPLKTNKISNSKENLLAAYGYKLENITDEIEKVIK